MRKNPTPTPRQQNMSGPGITDQQGDDASLGPRQQGDNSSWPVKQPQQASLDQKPVSPIIFRDWAAI